MPKALSSTDCIPSSIRFSRRIPTSKPGFISSCSRLNHSTATSPRVPSFIYKRLDRVDPTYQTAMWTGRGQDYISGINMSRAMAIQPDCPRCSPVTWYCLTRLPARPGTNDLTTHPPTIRRTGLSLYPRAKSQTIRTRCYLRASSSTSCHPRVGIHRQSL